MKIVRTLILGSFALAIVAFPAEAPTASASTSTTAPAAPSCTSPTRARLTFVVGEGSFRSQVALRFGPGTRPEDLVFVYAVDGCTLQDAGGLRVRALTSDIPSSAFGQPTFRAAGTYLVMTVPVDPRAFVPGEHDAVVGVFGPTISPVLEGVSLRRRYGNDAVVYAILVCAVALGLLWFGLGLAAASGNGRSGFRIPYAPLAIPAAAAAAFIVFSEIYLRSETWSLTYRTSLTLFLGCTAAAAGGAASGAVAKGMFSRRREGGATRSMGFEAPASATVTARPVPSGGGPEA